MLISKYFASIILTTKVACHFVRLFSFNKISEESNLSAKYPDRFLEVFMVVDVATSIELETVYYKLL